MLTEIGTMLWGWPEVKRICVPALMWQVSGYAFVHNSTIWLTHVHILAFLGLLDFLIYICLSSPFGTDICIFFIPKYLRLKLFKLNFISPLNSFWILFPLFEGTCLPVRKCQEICVDLLAGLFSFAKKNHEPPFKEWILEHTTFSCLCEKILHC